MADRFQRAKQVIMIVHYEYVPDITGMVKKTSTYGVANPKGNTLSNDVYEESRARTQPDYSGNWFEKRKGLFAERATNLDFF